MFEIPTSGLFGSAFSLLGGAVMRFFPNFDWFGAGLLVLGFLFLAEALRQTIFKKLQWSFYPAWYLSFKGFLPFIVLIPLEKAAQEAYEKLDGTLLAKSAVKMATPEGPVNYIATNIADSIPVYGTKPHHQKLKIIDKDKIGLIKNNGKNMSANSDKIILFNNLHVPLSEYKKYFNEKYREISTKHSN